MEVLAIRLKELRKEKKISLDRLGGLIGVSDTAILKWEQNKSEPTALNIKQLAIFFNVSADYLLGLEDDTGTKTYNNYGVHNGDVKF
ncbi:MAG: helix-turn-helix domain-containing protein [Clostridiales bacterium]|nr:helix-turn-helix domain-containing protein [Clostridiales bacterium]